MHTWHLGKSIHRYLCVLCLSRAHLCPVTVNLNRFGACPFISVPAGASPLLFIACGRKARTNCSEECSSAPGRRDGRGAAVDQFQAVVRFFFELCCVFCFPFRFPFSISLSVIIFYVFVAVCHPLFARLVLHLGS